MISAVIGALVIGLLAIFSLVIGQGIVSSQTTTAWPAITSTILNNIVPIIGIVGIVAMFIVVVKVSGGFGGGGGI